MLSVPSASAEGKGSSSWAAQLAPDALHGTGAAEMSHWAAPASRARDEPLHAFRGAEAAPAGASDGGASAPADDAPRSHYEMYVEKLALLADVDAKEQEKLDECFAAGADFVRAEQPELDGLAHTAKGRRQAAGKARKARFNKMNQRIGAAKAAAKAGRRRGDEWEAAREAADAAQRRHKKQRVEDPPGAPATALTATCCLEAPGPTATCCLETRGPTATCCLETRASSCGCRRRCAHGSLRQ